MLKWVSPLISVLSALSVPSAPCDLSPPVCPVCPVSLVCPSALSVPSFPSVRLYQLFHLFRLFCLSCLTVLSCLSDRQTAAVWRAALSVCPVWLSCRVSMSDRQQRSGEQHCPSVLSDCPVVSLCPTDSGGLESSTVRLSCLTVLSCVSDRQTAAVWRAALSVCPVWLSCCVSLTDRQRRSGEQHCPSVLSDCPVVSLSGRQRRSGEQHCPDVGRLSGHPALSGPGADAVCRLPHLAVSLWTGRRRGRLATDAHGVQGWTRPTGPHPRLRLRPRSPGSRWSVRLQITSRAGGRVGVGPAATPAGPGDVRAGHWSDSGLRHRGLLLCGQQSTAAQGHRSSGGQRWEREVRVACQNGEVRGQGGEVRGQDEMSERKVDLEVGGWDQEVIPCRCLEMLEVRDVKVAVPPWRPFVIISSRTRPRRRRSSFTANGAISIGYWTANSLELQSTRLKWGLWPFYPGLVQCKGLLAKHRNKGIIAKANSVKLVWFTYAEGYLPEHIVWFIGTGKHYSTLYSKQIILYRQTFIAVNVCRQLVH